MECTKCHKLKIGELQAICKNCGFSDGNDRWFAHDSRSKQTHLLRDS